MLKINNFFKSILKRIKRLHILGMTLAALAAWVASYFNIIIFSIIMISLIPAEIVSSEITWIDTVLDLTLSFALAIASSTVPFLFSVFVFIGTIIAFSDVAYYRDKVIADKIAEVTI